MTGLQIWLIIALIADILLLVSGWYLYHKEQKTRYLIVLFMGVLLLVLLALSIVMAFILN